MTTETLDNTIDAGQDILDELDLDAALGDASDLDLDLDLDAVINADPEDEETDGVRAYDFNQPHRISKQLEQNLHNIAEQYTRAATVNLTSLLRSNVVMDFQGIQLRSFSDYRAALPHPACLAAVTLRPLNGLSLVHLDMGLCFVILKKMMGGRPDSEDKLRSFTEIERGIFNHFTMRLTDLLKTASSKLLEIHPELVVLENNPDYVSGIPAGETLACLKFRLRIEAVEGVLELALPLSAFTPVRDIFDPEEKVEVRSSVEMREDQGQILDMMQTTASELVVRLGEISMPLSRVMDLGEGDLLHLPQALSAPLTVLIEGREVFEAEAGRINQNRAVKLVRKLEKE